MISLRGLPDPVRALARLAFGLLAAVVVALLVNNLVRGASSLLTVTNVQPGRGGLVPEPVLPITLFLLSVAFAFMLAGALHARLGICLLVLGLFVVVGSGWVALGEQTAVTRRGSPFLGWLALLGVVAFFALRRRARPRPGLEFMVLLVLVSVLFAVAQDRLLQIDRVSGEEGSFTVTQTSGLLLSLSTLAIPALFTIGFGVAELAQKATSWSVSLARERLPVRAIAALLAALVAWRLVAGLLHFADRAGDGSVGAAIGTFAGALGVPLIVGLAWWAVARRRPEEPPEVELDAVSDRGRAMLPAILLPYLAITLATVLAALVIETLVQTGVALTEPGQLGDATDAILDVQRRDALWTTLVDIAIIAIGVRLARRGRRLVPLFLVMVGGLDLWIKVTAEGRLLGVLEWTGEAVGFWWTVLAAGLAAFWAARRELDGRRLEALLIVVVLTILIGQAELLEDPFGPFLGLGGVVVIAVGVVWDLLSAGEWANRDTAGFPRASRLFVYLGYVLFSITLIHWALSVHDLTSLEFLTSRGALAGFTLLGQPLLYAAFALVLAAALRPRAAAAPAGSGKRS